MDQTIVLESTGDQEELKQEYYKEVRIYTQTILLTNSILFLMFFLISPYEDPKYVIGILCVIFAVENLIVILINYFIHVYGEDKDFNKGLSKLYDIIYLSNIISLGLITIMLGTLEYNLQIG